MMEYPSGNDFFLSFKSLISYEGNFDDYMLIKASNNFHNVTNIKAELILGRKISDIILEYENELFGIKEIYYNMIPKTRRKFEKYFPDIDRWYLISIFSDDRESLIVFYNDITKIKKSKVSFSHTSKENVSRYATGDTMSCFGYKDKLTGLYNRGFFEEELIRLDSARQLPVSIIMGDLNGLKLINDAFGHGMGDKALKKVVALMRKAFRKEDIISRVGGDEFVVLLPKTTEATALSIVKKIQQESSVEQLGHIKISVSFGVASKTIVEENMNAVYKKAEDRMYFSKLKESKDAKISMIKHLKDKLEEISFESKAHYERLKNLCLMLATRLELSDLEKEEIKLLCELHDIGQIGIPSKILQKKDVLNDEEWDCIRRHSQIGYHIIGASKETLAIEELILVHHERWDGKGYPGLLKNDDIPLVARIFTIVDSYEAMVNDRPYKGRMNITEALKEIERQAGTQFDPKLARIFINMMYEREESAV